MLFLFALQKHKNKFNTLKGDDTSTVYYLYIDGTAQPQFFQKLQISHSHLGCAGFNPVAPRRFGGTAQTEWQFIHTLSYTKTEMCRNVSMVG